MARFRWPLEPEADRRVRERVARRLLERHRRNWDAQMDEMPLLNQPSGRERLAMYRQSTPEQWAEIASTYPEEARRMMRDWATLLKRYEPMPAYEAVGQI